MKKVLAFCSIAALVITMIGCLSAERKEYTWNIEPDGSGSGKIVWRNLFSSGNEDEDGSADDFVSLVNDYYEGTYVEDDYPGWRNVEKRLFMEKGQLCGEITFEFKRLSDIGFYQYNGEGPFMFLTSTDETFIDSNGDFAGEDFPVMFWPEKTSEFKLVTSLGDPDDSGAIELLDYYEDWTEDGELPEIDEVEYDFEEEEEGEEEEGAGKKIKESMQ